MQKKEKEKKRTHAPIVCTKKVYYLCLTIFCFFVRCVRFRNERSSPRTSCDWMDLKTRFYIYITGCLSSFLRSIYSLLFSNILSSEHFCTLCVYSPVDLVKENTSYVMVDKAFFNVPIKSNTNKRWKGAKKKLTLPSK